MRFQHSTAIKDLLIIAPLHHFFTFGFVQRLNRTPHRQCLGHFEHTKQIPNREQLQLMGNHFRRKQQKQSMMHLFPTSRALVGGRRKVGCELYKLFHRVVMSYQRLRGIEYTSVMASTG
jgi:hypothetical protein